MGKLLEAFADDGLCVIPAKEERTPEHQEACDRAYALADELEEKLNEEEKSLLEKVLDAVGDEQVFCLRERFIRGYCLGVLMMAEVLERKDGFLQKK